jgi:enoyl-CoA hydratase/carnithine racemase
MRTDFETVLVAVEGGVATLTLNRPERGNAFNHTMDREFHEAMWALEAADEVRVIVVTGAGKVFCGGVDLEPAGDVFGAGAHEAHDAALGVDSDTVGERAAFWRMRTPVIGAINGSALGAGLTVPMLFDIRYVAEDAKLGFVFTRRGIFPEANSNWLLPRLVGLGTALDLLLTGRMFSGREAVEMGLASRALPREEVLPAALELARDLAANTAPASVGIAKEMIYAALREPDRMASMRLETKITWWLGTHPDAMEGIMAFLQRRPPQWSGSKHLELPEGLQIGR